jgi:hypothetical protein
MENLQTNKNQSNSNMDVSVNFLVNPLTNQPCYYAIEQGIYTCSNCPAKFVCPKSPERKIL